MGGHWPGCPEPKYLAEVAAHAATQERYQKRFDDSMIAHRWFAKHFGEIMNGRDFAVKCPMADEQLAATREQLAQARKDTERLDWLENNTEQIVAKIDWPHITDGTFREAIDAARAAGILTEEMNLWLDDVREPHLHGALGWVWAKTAQEAIEYLKTGRVKKASLDHDLSPDHYPWSEVPLEFCEGTGYDVVLFLEANPQYLPSEWTKVHSMNPVGRARMEMVLLRLYRKRNQNENAR